MRRSRTERASSAQPKDRNQSSHPPRREKNEKEDGKPSILTAGGLIFMALCLSALSSGLRTEKDLTPKSETTNDKEGQANNSGAEKNSNATITPPAIPPAPTTTPPAPAPTNLIQRFFALWASPTPTKEDNTKTTEPTANESPKSVSFEATPRNVKHDTEQSVNPKKTTEPAPPTSILKQTNPSVNEPKTASAPSILKSLFSFFSKDTQANKDNSPALVEVKKTSGEAPELTSDNKPPQAKRAKTEILPKEDKAMKSLINKEVMKRMSQQDNPENSILVLENQKRVNKNEVTLDFINKFENGDPDFQKRLEQEIKALASLEERTSKAFSSQRDEGLVKNEPGAKRAETKKSPEEKAMKNLIVEEVATRMAGIKIRDRTNRATELRGKIKEKVTAEFIQKSKNDPLFKELLENQIKLSAVQEAQSKNGGKKKEVKPTSVAAKAVKITDHESPGTSSPMSHGEAKQMRLSKLDPRERDPIQAKIDDWGNRMEDQDKKRAENESAKAKDLGLHIARHNTKAEEVNGKPLRKPNQNTQGSHAMRVIENQSRPGRSR